MGLSKLPALSLPALRLPLLALRVIDAGDRPVVNKRR